MFIVRVSSDPTKHPNVDKLETRDFHEALGFAAHYLNTTYGQRAWHLSEFGQFIVGDVMPGRPLLLSILYISDDTSDPFWREASK